VACLILALVVAGCGVVGPRRLEVLPGQRVTLGRIELRGLDFDEVRVEIVREDRSYGAEIVLDHMVALDFMIGLPPGRYRIDQIRVQHERSATNEPVRRVQVAFEIGDAPATYLGTLRLHGEMGPRVRAEVIDDYTRTVPRLRAQYVDFPATVARALMVAG
jgi:predicted metallopeptidase